MNANSRKGFVTGRDTEHWLSYAKVRAVIPLIVLDELDEHIGRNIFFEVFPSVFDSQLYLVHGFEKRRSSRLKDVFIVELLPSENATLSISKPWRSPDPVSSFILNLAIVITFIC